MTDGWWMEGWMDDRRQTIDDRYASQILIGGSSSWVSK